MLTFSCDRKCTNHRVPWAFYQNIRDACFWIAQKRYNYYFWVDSNSSSICIHKIQRHLWAFVLFHALYVAIKSPLSLLSQNEHGSTWDWDWPPHALMLHLISGHGRRQQHVFHTRWWKENCDSYADERSTVHRPFPNPPCIVVIFSAQGTFIYV